MEFGKIVTGLNSPTLVILIKTNRLCVMTVGMAEKNVTITHATDCVTMDFLYTLCW
jgi:hypothetical protein